MTGKEPLGTLIETLIILVRPAIAQVLAGRARQARRERESVCESAREKESLYELWLC